MRAVDAPSTQALRGWQRRALVKYLAAKPRDFLAVATPGAGKTTFALRIVAELLAEGTVEAVTIVVPTEHLKIQWAQAAARHGIALDPNGDIIVADTLNARIRKIDASTGAVTTIAGLGTGVAPGTFAFPTDVAVNSAGDIFITDIGTKQVYVMRA